MSLRLTKPGMPAAGLVYPKWHARAGQQVEPVGILPSGKVVWPVIGGSEEQDDPDALPEGEEDDEDEEEDDEDEKKSSKKTSKKSDDDEDDEEDEDEKDSRPHRQAARYRIRAREAEKANRELRDRLKAIEDKDKKPDEIASRDLTEAQDKVAKLTQQNASMAAQLAFFRANTIQWVDPSDAFALAEREGLFEDVVDEDGNVDARELRRGLRDLAKRKPHLVKPTEDPKARGRKSKDDNDEDEDDEEQSSDRTKPMNSRRRGTKDTTSRAALAKRFPVLGR